MAKIIFSERVTQHGMVMNHVWRNMGAVEVRGYRLGTIANATCRMWRLNTQALQSLQVTLWSWQINQWDAGKQMSKCSIDWFKGHCFRPVILPPKNAMPDLKSYLDTMNKNSSQKRSCFSVLTSLKKWSYLSLVC